MTHGRGWLLPAGLAALLTALNAAKPAVVDDTAYLFTARHVAAHPTDPYGFDLFWYDRPMPAWEVLLPPVLPYWIALGIRVFGEHLVVLKLWLLPFALLLSYSLAFLLRHFARGVERTVLPMIVLGPSILPTFNVMLDVPAVALGMTAIACFVKSGSRRWFAWLLLAGIFAGLAVQTKYTMLSIPAAIALYGLTHRRIRAAGFVIAVAVGLFLAWEAFVWSKYGESHFLYHLREQGESVTSDADAASGWQGKVQAVWHEKSRLFQPMLGHLGWLGLGVGIIAAAGTGISRRWLAVIAGASAVGIAAVCVVPESRSEIVPDKLTLSTAVFVTLGSGVGLWVLAAEATLLFRPWNWRFIRWNRGSWFLAGWLFVELVGYFAMTPFPAARRVVGMSVVGGLIAARLLSRRVRRGGECHPPRWLAVYGMAVGVALFALDTWDALPEKVLAERASAVIPPGDHSVWFNGHWGFQYYCDRAGMKPVVPKEELSATNPTLLRQDDYLVFPMIPDDDGFYRPYHGGAKFRVDPDYVEYVAEFVWNDRLPAQTIPNLYGGEVPVTERAHPRLRVVVYKVRRDWTPLKVE